MEELTFQNIEKYTAISQKHGYIWNFENPKSWVEVALNNVPIYLTLHDKLPNSIVTNYYIVDDNKLSFNLYDGLHTEFDIPVYSEKHSKIYKKKNDKKLRYNEIKKTRIKKIKNQRQCKYIEKDFQYQKETILIDELYEKEEKKKKEDAYYEWLSDEADRYYYRLYWEEMSKR